MRKLIFLGLVITFCGFGCATQTDYNLHGFYKNKNPSLNLVSKLSIYKSGRYQSCTSTLDHENEHPGDGNYYCFEGVWTQQKSKVTLVANTHENKLFIWHQNESIAILERTENLANPTLLLIHHPSGKIMSDISVAEVKTAKVKGWGNYQRAKDFY